MKPETAHTPGPWMAHPIQRWVSPAADPEMPVCLLRYETRGVLCDEEEVRANARLIAAAPEMLEALEKVIATSPIEDSVLPLVLAAVNKARPHG